MKVSTPAFEDGGKIPSKYTCDGEDESPEISIDDVPSDAESLCLIVDDPDAPGGTFDHWIIWNIPADVSSLPADLPDEKILDLLDGARQGKNDFGEIGYRGPCPPGGPSHRYRFKAYALDSMLKLSAGASKSDFLKEMEGKIVEEDEIVGNYGR